MEINIESKFEEKLWGQCEKLHTRFIKKLELYENSTKKFETINNSLKDVIKLTKNIKLDLEPQSSSFFSRNSSGISNEELQKIFKGIPNTMIFIKNNIECIMDILNQLLESIITSILGCIKKMKEEKKEYDIFQKFSSSYYSSYQDRMKTIEKNEKAYHQKSKIAEKCVLDYKKLEKISNNVSEQSIIENTKEDEKKKSEKLLTESLKLYKIYKDNINKSNELRSELIKKQNNLLKLYYQAEVDSGNLNFDIISIFNENQKKLSELQQKNLIEIEEKRKKININEDINDIINTFTKNQVPNKEKKIKFFKSNINFDTCENSETFDIYLQTIFYIKCINIEEYPNFNEKVEKEKNELRELLENQFEKYSEKDKEKLMKLMENKLNYNIFFNTINRLKTDKFRNIYSEQNEKLMNLIGEILNKILDLAQSDNDYKTAQNCIRLAQTFSYNKKYILLEKIKTHNWLSTIDFWKDFISLNLNKELEKFVSFYQDINIKDIENISEKITDKLKLKLGDLLFSQILPNINNMVEFNINKELIFNIIEEFHKKYKYLNDENINCILEVISNDKEEIKKLKDKIKDDNNVIKIKNDNE